MRNIFRNLGLVRDTQGYRRKQRKTATGARGNGIHPERLEPRVLLAVDVFAATPLNGRENWVNVIVDNGDNAFVKHVGNDDQDMWVSNNSSFSDPEEVPNFLSTYDGLNIFEGQNVVRSNLRPQNAPYQTTTSQDTLTFFLPMGAIDTTAEISGVLLVGNTRYDFSSGTTDGTFSSPQLVAGEDIQANFFQGYDGPIDGAGQRNVVTRMDLRNSAFRGLSDATDVRIESITVDSDVFDTLTSDEYVPVTLANIVASSVEGVRTIQPFESEFWEAGRYIPGSLRGSLQLDFLDLSQAVPFQVDTTDVSIDDPNLGRTLIPLSFEDVFAPGVERSLEQLFLTNGFAEEANGGVVALPDSRVLSLTGTFDSLSGEIRLQTLLYDQGTGTPLAGQVVVATGNPLLIGPALSVTNLEVGLYTPAAVPVPSNATILPGETHTRGLQINLPTPGGRIRIDSPVVTTGTPFGQGDVSLAASDISIDAPVFAAETFIVPSVANSYLDTASERVVINAPVSSDSFTLQLVDSVATAEIPRSQLVVTQSGSLSNTANVLEVLPANLTEATRVFVEVKDGDIYIEGEVVAGLHSYVMSSSVGSEAEAPYFLTTRSRLTDLDVGVISGDTLSLTLGNDTLGENFLSIAISEVSLTTDVTRLRTQASSRAGDPLEEMFPYKLTINEADDLIIDAVAGTSETLSIAAGGSLSLLGSIRSQADVVLESVADFQVNAPITTSFGSVTMRGPNVVINSAVRVLDAVQDERLTDILIEATEPSGGMVLNDAISGLNRVQLNSAGSVTGDARVRADVVDVNANGDVRFSTAANLVTVDASGAVRVEDESAVAFEVRESSDVTLVSMGMDRLVDHDNDAGTPDKLSPALYADVFDTEQITVSAPNGSIDVLHHGSQPIEVGDIGEIDGGIEVTPGTAAMLAGGSAVIRSTLSPTITIRDFPAALSSANQVRIATTEPLPAGASYTRGPGEPGTYATILRVNLPYDTEDLNGNGVLDDGEVDSNGNGVLDPVEDENGNGAMDPPEDRNGNDKLDTGSRRLPAFDMVFASKIRIGDRMLIKNGKYLNLQDQLNRDFQQVDESINGIYVVLGINYISGDKVEFTLARSTEFDESPELRNRHYVTVTGVADPNNIAADANTLAGKGFASRSFENVSPFENNVPNEGLANDGVIATPLEVNRVPSRPGYVVARAATSQTIFTEAAFSEASQVDSDSNLWVDEIIATNEGFIDQYSSLFNGVPLEKNDIVLVREPVGESSGGEDIGAPTDAAIGLYTVANVGSATEKWVLERYRGIDENGDGTVDQVVEGVVVVAEGTLRTALTGEMFKLSYRALHESGLPYDSITDYRDTLSGAEQPGNPAAYIVNNIQPFDSVAQFRTDVGTNNPNGTVNFEISTEGGSNTAPGSLGRMLDVLQSNSAYISRTGDRQPYTTTFSSNVTNIVLDQQLPAISTPVSLEAASRITIDGSEITRTRDGAIVPTGTITAGIGPVRPSQESTARRLIRSSDVSGGLLNGLELLPSAEGSVIRNLQIGGFSTGAAILVGGAKNVLIDNVILGRDINGPLPNRYGVYVQNVMADAQGSEGRVDYTTISNSQIYSSSVSGIYLGTNTNNVRVVDGNIIGTINEGNSVGLKIDSVAGRNIVGAAPFIESVTGVQSVARSTKMLLPLFDEDGNQKFNPDDLFLGQVLDSLDGSSIAAGTVIAAIERRYAENDPTDLTGIELTLSQELTDTANISVTLSAPDARNTIQYNSDGVVLESGSSRMVTTDVTRSVFDGVVINGVGNNKITPSEDKNGNGRLDDGEDANGNGRIDYFKHQIGGVEYAGVTGENIQNLSNNSIHSNGLAGIVFKDAFFSQLANNTDKLAMAGAVKIEGNYLGTDTNQSSGLTNGRDGASNIVVEQVLDEAGTTDEHEDIRKLLLVDATPNDNDPRDGGLYYTARYRAEDNPDSDPDLVSRDGLDQEGNYHVAGDPLSGPGPNPTPGDPDDPRGPSRPPTMR